MFNQGWQKIISLQFLAQVPRKKCLLWLSPWDLCGVVTIYEQADDILFYKVEEKSSVNLYSLSFPDLH